MNAIIEKCIVCGTTNHIFIDYLGTVAWECYFCEAKFWLDETCKEQYIIENECSEEEAEHDLQNGSDKIFFLSGSYIDEN